MKRKDVHRQWLRELRLSKNLTIAELAEMVGVTAQYIGDIEHGRRNPAYKLALTLSDLLGFPLERMYVDALERQERVIARKKAQ